MCTRIGDVDDGRVDADVCEGDVVRLLLRIGTLIGNGVVEPLELTKEQRDFLAVRRDARIEDVQPEPGTSGAPSPSAASTEFLLSQLAKMQSKQGKQGKHTTR